MRVSHFSSHRVPGLNVDVPNANIRVVFTFTASVNKLDQNHMSLFDMTVQRFYTPMARAARDLFVERA